MVEFFNERQHTAKKEHICALCRQKIKSGENYYRQSGKIDGDFFDNCLHKSCNDIIAKYCYVSEVNEWSPTDIRSWLRNDYCYDCEDYEDCDVAECRCEKIIKEVE